MQPRPARPARCGWPSYSAGRRRPPAGGRARARQRRRRRRRDRRHDQRPAGRGAARLCPRRRHRPRLTRPRTRCARTRPCGSTRWSPPCRSGAPSRHWPRSPGTAPSCSHARRRRVELLARVVRRDCPRPVAADPRPARRRRDRHPPRVLAERASALGLAWATLRCARALDAYRRASRCGPSRERRVGARPTTPGPLLTRAGEQRAGYRARFRRRRRRGGRAAVAGSTSGPPASGGAVAAGRRPARRPPARPARRLARGARAADLTSALTSRCRATVTPRAHAGRPAASPRSGAAAAVPARSRPARRSGARARRRPP